MPVSHLGLCVQNVAQAASFYAAALQPLGYRYVGAKDNQIGFGVDEADFFLTQASSRPSPIHVAFSANSTLMVRDFYACALRAGGVPAGEPIYRGEESQIFNAAVADLEGNTVEVVYHLSPQPNGPPSPPASPTYCKSYAPAQSQAPSRNDRDNSSHITSPTQLISPRRRSASSSNASSTRSHHSSNTNTTRRPRSNEHEDAPSKRLVGTLLGAAASAAALCAMLSNDHSHNHKSQDMIRSFSDDLLSRFSHHSNNNSKTSKSHRRASYDLELRASAKVPRRSTWDDNNTTSKAKRRDSLLSTSTSAQSPRDSNKEHITYRIRVRSPQRSSQRTTTTTTSIRDPYEADRYPSSRPKLRASEPARTSFRSRWQDEDAETVVPEDSVSCCSSERRSHRGQRSRRDGRDGERSRVVAGVPGERRGRRY